MTEKLTPTTPTGLREQLKELAEAIVESFARGEFPHIDNGDVSLLREAASALLASEQRETALREVLNEQDVWILRHQILPNQYAIKRIALERILDGIDRLFSPGAQTSDGATTKEDR